MGRKKRIPCTNVRISLAIVALAHEEAERRDEPMGNVLFRAAEMYFGKEKLEESVRKLRSESYQQIKKTVAEEIEATDRLF